jgi:serine/threonine protein phosphatase 1
MIANQHRQIIIGDVHGHYDGLMNLLGSIGLVEGDQVYFLGDLIDRGPASAQVVDFVQQGNYPCLLGNHEQMLIDAFPSGRVSPRSYQAWLYSGGTTTIESYEGDTQKLLAHIQWMKTLPLYLDLDSAWLVHAGVDPNRPLEQQSSREFCWIREVFHHSKKPYFPNKTIITGHTITFTLPGISPGSIAQGNGWLNIETGAYHPKSGWLTGLDWQHQQVYQANVFSKETRTLPLADLVINIAAAGYI